MKTLLFSITSFGWTLCFIMFLLMIFYVVFRSIKHSFIIRKTNKWLSEGHLDEEIEDIVNDYIKLQKQTSDFNSKLDAVCDKIPYEKYHKIFKKDVPVKDKFSVLIYHKLRKK